MGLPGFQPGVNFDEIKDGGTGKYNELSHNLYKISMALGELNNSMIVDKLITSNTSLTGNTVYNNLTILEGANLDAGGNNILVKGDLVILSSQLSNCGNLEVYGDIKVENKAGDAGYQCDFHSDSVDCHGDASFEGCATFTTDSNAWMKVGGNLTFENCTSIGVLRTWVGGNFSHNDDGSSNSLLGTENTSSGVESNILVDGNINIPNTINADYIYDVSSSTLQSSSAGLNISVVGNFTGSGRIDSRSPQGSQDYSPPSGGSHYFFVGGDCTGTLVFYSTGGKGGNRSLANTPGKGGSSGGQMDIHITGSIIGAVDIYTYGGAGGDASGGASGPQTGGNGGNGGAINHTANTGIESSSGGAGGSEANGGSDGSTGSAGTITVAAGALLSHFPKQVTMVTADEASTDTLIFNVPVDVNSSDLDFQIQVEQQLNDVYTLTLFDHNSNDDAAYFSGSAPYTEGTGTITYTPPAGLSAGSLYRYRVRSMKDSDTTYTGLWTPWKTFTKET